MNNITITINKWYFMCSSLPLLNGDIKIILDMSVNSISLIELLKLILSKLEYDYDKIMPRKIKKEYLRMIKLYKFRINVLELRK